jgi:hypothetical protein
MEKVNKVDMGVEIVTGILKNQLMKDLKSHLKSNPKTELNKINEVINPILVRAQSQLTEDEYYTFASPYNDFVQAIIFLYGHEEGSKDDTLDSEIIYKELNKTEKKVIRDMILRNKDLTPFLSEDEPPNLF